jgi:GTPase SAR1 family protein
VFLICFSLISPWSFDNIESKWVPEGKACLFFSLFIIFFFFKKISLELVMHHCPEAARVLCGTKLDLRSDPETIAKLKAKHLAPITQAQGIEAAKKLGFHAYVEHSALTQEGLKDCFDTCIRIVIAPPDGKPRVQKTTDDKCILC